MKQAGNAPRKHTGDSGLQPGPPSPGKGYLGGEGELTPFRQGDRFHRAGGATSGQFMDVFNQRLLQDVYDMATSAE